MARNISVSASKTCFLPLRLAFRTNGQAIRIPRHSRLEREGLAIRYAQSLNYRLPQALSQLEPRDPMNEIERSINRYMAYVYITLSRWAFAAAICLLISAAYLHFTPPAHSFVPVELEGWWIWSQTALALLGLFAADRLYSRARLNSQKADDAKLRRHIN